MNVAADFAQAVSNQEGTQQRIWNKSPKASSLHSHIVPFVNKIWSVWLLSWIMFTCSSELLFLQLTLELSDRTELFSSVKCGFFSIWKHKESLWKLEQIFYLKKQKNQKIIKSEYLRWLYGFPNINISPAKFFTSFLTIILKQLRSIPRKLLILTKILLWATHLSFHFMFQAQNYTANIPLGIRPSWPHSRTQLIQRRPETVISEVVFRFCLTLSLPVYVSVC